MRFPNVWILCLLVLTAGLFGCGDGSDDPGVILEGTYTLGPGLSSADGPVLVALTTSIDQDALENQPRDVVVEYMAADRAAQTFRMDLSDKHIRPDQDYFLFAFVDQNYSGDVPFPDPGDVMGIYAEEGRISPAIRLAKGKNSGFQINITREVFDYTASVSGTVLGEDAGPVTLVAYAGDIDSSDFTNLDFDAVVGYQTLEKGDDPEAYTIDILPYGKNVPIANVQVFALLDANASQTVDAGDKIGFYGEDDDFSTLLTVDDGTELTGIDLEFKFDVEPPCGMDITLSGDFTLPEPYGETSPPVYIAVLDGDNPSGALDDPFGAVVYFTRIPGGVTEFSLDLSDTGLCPGDEILVVGLWDRDFAGGLPNFTPGDRIGIYASEGRISPSVALSAGENSGFHIDIIREVFDYTASVSGTIHGNDAGPVTLVAYAGDMDSSDFTNLDFNAVMGYKTIEKPGSSISYTLDILPYGRDVPMADLQIFALLDANASQTVDAGDKIGFYGAGEEFSTLLTIDDGTALAGIDMEFKFDVRPPCGMDITLSGDFTLPEPYGETSPPVYIAVLDGDNPSGALDDPFGAVVYFTRIPGGVTEFFLDLSDTGLCPGDEILVVGLWDRDFSGGFPNFTPGDRIGIYAQEGRISPSVALAAGENSGFHIDIIREVFDYTASVSGTIHGNDAGPVTLVAYAGNMDSSDFTNLDFNAVMGFKTIEKPGSPISYTLDILPYGRDVPMADLQIFALLDANASQTVDAGDKIGFYGAGEEFSTLLTIDDGTALAGIDMEFKFDVRPPCGADITLSGAFTLPSAYTLDAPPVYIAVLDGSDPAGVVEDPFASILYFSKIPQGTMDFALDLSQTGICPGDPVLVAGLWDRDFKGGIPNFTVGDFIGIYVEEGKISPAVALAAGRNSGFQMDINREVFDYEASVSGRILGDDGGRVILVAYAGEVLSSDFTGLDFNDVIGYETLMKPSASAAYQMEILPYGRNVPIADVQIFAILDANGNSRVDGGDKIGFYSRGEEYSSRVTITDGAALTGIDIEFKTTVQEASEIPMSLTGAFSVSDDYLKGEGPIFVLVFDSDNPNDILSDPFSVLKYFYRMPEDDLYFDIDLSTTDLVPGDAVIIAALWDRDFTGGFPRPTRGDKLGLVIDKETYQFTVPLNYGKNIVPPQGYDFNINKNIYDFSADMDYAIDLSDAGSFDSLRAKLLVLAIHVEGVSVGVSMAGEIVLDIDVDYLLGMDVISPVEYDYIGIGNRTDPRCPRQLPILTALYDQLTVWENSQPPDPLINGVDHGQAAERTAYLVAVLDKNGNGQLDDNDEIGYYGDMLVNALGDYTSVDIPWLGDILIPDWFEGSLMFPSPVPRIVKGNNRETREDGTSGPYWISNFINQF